MGRRARLGLTASVLATLVCASACSVTRDEAPRCGSPERVAIIAQSVPTASYVPCLLRLPAGWTSGRFQVRSGRTSYILSSDRAAGHPVVVELRARCRSAGATPIPARTPGGRTSLRVREIDPRYAGTMFDVFPGGCVSYRFDFARGPHIALMADLEASVGLVTRIELRRLLRDQLGVELDP
jgi:hypothetical protein